MNFGWWAHDAGANAILLACVPALAIAIDRLLGEPTARWHPVVWMGRYLAWAGERLAPRANTPRVLSDARVFWFAAASWCAAAAAVFALAWLFQAWVLAQPMWLAALALGLFLKPLLAWAMLHDEVLAVERALAESLPAGDRGPGRHGDRDADGEACLPERGAGTAWHRRLNAIYTTMEPTDDQQAAAIAQPGRVQAQP